MLPMSRYNIVKALLFEKDFFTLTITKVVNKIRSHEMFMMEDIESSTSNSSSKKDLALRLVRRPSSSRPMQSLLLPQVREKAKVIQLKWRAMMQSLLTVTTPSEIIPYYRLNHSIWSLSDNKE
jgi:hypothetical protein